MRKLEISDAEVMQVAIRQEIARSEESRYDHRLHGLLLVTKGESARSWPSSSTRMPAPCSAGCSASRPGASRACGRASVLGVRVRSIRANGSVWRASSAAPRASPDTRPNCGRQALGRAPEKASRRALGGAPVPAAVRATRVSTAQAPSASGPSGSAEGCGGLKNRAASQSVATLSCGTWTNATSSSTARAPGCGWPRRSATRYCCMPPRANPWLASGR